MKAVPRCAENRVLKLALVLFIIIITLLAQKTEFNQHQPVKLNIYTNTFEKFPASGTEIYKTENGIHLSQTNEWLFFEFHHGRKIGVQTNPTLTTLLTKLTEPSVTAAIPTPVIAVSLNHLHELKSHFGDILAFLGSLPDEKRPNRILVYRNWCFVNFSVLLTLCAPKTLCARWGPKLSHGTWGPSSDFLIPFMVPDRLVTSVYCRVGEFC